MRISFDSSGLSIFLSPVELRFKRIPPAAHRLVEIWLAPSGVPLSRISHGMHGFLEEIDGAWAGGAHGHEVEDAPARVFITILDRAEELAHGQRADHVDRVELVTHAILGDLGQVRRTVRHVLHPLHDGLAYQHETRIDALVDHARGRRYLDMLQLAHGTGWDTWHPIHAEKLSIDAPDDTSHIEPQRAAALFHGQAREFEIRAPMPSDWEWTTANLGYTKIYCRDRAPAEQRAAGTTYRSRMLWHLRMPRM